LFTAVRNNDLIKLKKDIFLGADINAKNKHGDTLIISAVKLDRYECFNYLLHAGADIYIEDSLGQNVIDLITEGRKYEYILSLVRAGYKIADCRDQLMEWITNGETLFSPADIKPETLADMEIYFCKIASSLHYYYGPKIVSYIKGGIILDLLGSVIVTLQYQDGEMIAAVTAASPVHPKPFPNKNIKTEDWYNVLIDYEENAIIAIQAGIKLPYTRKEMIDLITQLHDEVIELYLEATKGGKLHAV